MSMPNKSWENESKVPQPSYNPNVPVTAPPAYYPTGNAGYTNAPPPSYSVAIGQTPGSAPIYYQANPAYPTAHPYIQNSGMVYATTQPGVYATYAAAPAAFDAGARFDGTARPNIPPPPPGVSPNAAQIAQMHGQNVVVPQRQSTFWGGGSDGGYTFW